MTSRKIIDCCKNALGTVFLLAGAFFVCSTLLSMRAVFADPVAPVTAEMSGPMRTVNAHPARVSARGNTTATRNASVARAASARSTGTVAAPVRGSGVATSGARTVSARTVSARPGGGAGTARTAATGARTATARTVTARTGTVSRGTTGTASRGVRARSATTAARVSVAGDPISASRATGSYTYLVNRLRSGNYSNIIDSSTGLISNDAYTQCEEAYFACMDEICTARSVAQRRCACAGRVRSFAAAEAALETSNAELIKASGELALLIANKGKDVREAFQLTEAEQVMNCVSWKEMNVKYEANYRYYEGGEYKTQCEDDPYCPDAGKHWCQSHGIYEDTKCDGYISPDYCSVASNGNTGGNTFGFNISEMTGASSDILATLQSWADAEQSAMNTLRNNPGNLDTAVSGMTSALNQLLGVSGNTFTQLYDPLDVDSSSNDLNDSLANTWGYDLFAYANNNVCNRVLDACFNGIYEACGTLPSGFQRNCANGESTCPYNYNSMIKVDNNGAANLTFITPSSGTNQTNTAACFGYANGSDPYSDLRGPVADARRSILQKYALAANADCDAYGEQLRTVAQKISYQKVAAQQALQQKRLEFANAEHREMQSAYTTAMDNFNECLSELYDCYTDMAENQSNWSTSRIKVYCSQESNAPHCYEEMVAGPAGGVLQAVVSSQDVANCTADNDVRTNTCRNVVTISEILSGNYVQTTDTDTSSRKRREATLQSIGINGVRQWTKNYSADEEWPDSDSTAYSYCGANQHVCTNTDINDYGILCTLETCTNNIDMRNAGLSGDDPHAATYQRNWNALTAWGMWRIAQCAEGYRLSSQGCVSVCGANQHWENGDCLDNSLPCTVEEMEDLGMESYCYGTASKQWNNGWGDCEAISCAPNCEIQTTPDNHTICVQ